MDIHILLDNLTNPALLFFVLGLLAVRFKSDLEIPPTSSKFISIYLLFSIGFKGGQELSHSQFDAEIIYSILFAILLATVVPLYTFFILRKKLDVYNSGAIAAAYGSVSAVTFVTTVSFLEFEGIEFGGHMIAMMAIMEAPAIIVGMIMISYFGSKDQAKLNYLEVIKHALTNGSVLLIIGSLVIGYIASDAQAEGIKPFTTDLFKGFLAVFLLDMGITSGRKLESFLKNGWFVVLFAIFIPLLNGVVTAFISGCVTNEFGNRMLFAILAASASYIAVPAAMKLVVPKANPSLYIPMALAVTFPLNISVGIPIYLMVIRCV